MSPLIWCDKLSVFTNLCIVGTQGLIISLIVAAMSFRFVVGDVVAVLGVFEYVALELRGYKNALMHFQQFGIELGLLYSIFNYVFSLSPKDLSKDSSLGYYCGTRSLSNISIRLDWSMIARKDVEDFCTTVLLEMVVINMLLST